MRSLMFGLSGVLVLGSFACSDDSDGGGVAGGVAVAGSAGTSNAVAGAGGGASTGGGTAVPAGGASSGGSGSELGIGGNVELLPGAGAGGADGSNEVGADAGVTPPVLGAVCPPGPFAADPLEGAAAPQIVCDGMSFTEGAVWFAERNQLFFSDFQIGTGAANGRIMSFTPGGECEEFIPNAGTNGLVIGLDGNLLGARHVDQTLTSFDLETGEATVFLADNAGLAFNSPNDITIRSDGNLYFTDPNYFLAGRPMEQPMRAYRRDPNGVVSVVDETGTPNGITLSPDETRLYVSRLNQGQPSTIAVFDVDASGATSNPQTFIADRGSDGMAIDCAGNLYITNAGVQVFSPAGELIGSIDAPQAANVAFGGPERRTLFITAGATLRTVELAIPGLPY